MWDPVPQLGIKPRPLALGTWILSHWTTREVLLYFFFFLFNLQLIKINEKKIKRKRKPSLFFIKPLSTLLCLCQRCCPVPSLSLLSLPPGSWVPCCSGITGITTWGTRMTGTWATSRASWGVGSGAVCCRGWGRIQTHECLHHDRGC